MTGTISRTDEVLILLNRLEANPDEEALKTLPHYQPKGARRKASIVQAQEPQSVDGIFQVRTACCIHCVERERLLGSKALLAQGQDL